MGITEEDIEKARRAVEELAESLFGNRDGATRHFDFQDHFRGPGWFALDAAIATLLLEDLPRGYGALAPTAHSPLARAAMLLRQEADAHVSGAYEDWRQGINTPWTVDSYGANGRAFLPGGIPFSHDGKRLVAVAYRPLLAHHPNDLRYFGDLELHGLRTPNRSEMEALTPALDELKAEPGIYVSLERESEMILDPDYCDRGIYSDNASRIQVWNYPCICTRSGRAEFSMLRNGPCHSILVGIASG